MHEDGLLRVSCQFGPSQLLTLSSQLRLFSSTSSFVPWQFLCVTDFTELTNLIRLGPALQQQFIHAFDPIVSSTVAKMEIIFRLCTDMTHFSMQPSILQQLSCLKRLWQRESTPDPAMLVWRTETQPSTLTAMPTEQKDLPRLPPRQRYVRTGFHPSLLSSNLLVHDHLPQSNFPCKLFAKNTGCCSATQILCKARQGLLCASR